MTTFFTHQSHKAWVAGVLTALLTPTMELLTGTNVLTIRSLVIAVLSGILGAVAVWATDNAEPPPPAPAATGTATGTQTAASPVVEPAPDDLTDNFPGQTIPGI